LKLNADTSGGLVTSRDALVTEFDSGFCEEESNVVSIALKEDEINSTFFVENVPTLIVPCVMGASCISLIILIYYIFFD
jgi:hypothetical protein